MKKIMLCCSAGMSTSLLVKKMVEEAQKRGLEVDIKAMDYGIQKGGAVLDFALSLIDNNN